MTTSNWQLLHFDWQKYLHTSKFEMVLINSISVVQFDLIQLMKSRKANAANYHSVSKKFSFCMEPIVMVPV